MSVPSGRIAGILKLERPAYTKKKRPLEPIDWQEVERRWRERPVTFAALARSLGVSRSRVYGQLQHLVEEQRARPKPLTSDQRANLYALWHHNVQASDDPSHSLYRWVGARGRTIHPAWRDFETFWAWALESGYAPNLWLRRLDNRKGHSPENSRWMQTEIARRMPKFGVEPQRKTRWAIEAFGETKSLSEWTRDPRCKASGTTLARRLRAGWDAEAAIETVPNAWGREPTEFATAFGETKSYVDWVRDPRCKIGYSGLCERIFAGIPAEVAIATPGHQLDPSMLCKRGPRRRARPKPKPT